jgi:hypothetical protein
MTSLKATAVALCLPACGAFGAIADSQAVRAIVGEAGNQSPRTMLAIADAIRHRGTLHGVFGLHNSYASRQPSRVWQAARAAWQQSASIDLVAGATHWATAADLATGIFDGMKRVAVVGDFTFLRPTN